MSVNSISISSFPEDDERYIIRNYGLVRKNPSPNASVYLAEVYLESLDTGKKLTKEIIFTHLIAARIGSVWKNKEKIFDYHSSKKEGFVEKEMSFDFKNTTSPSTKLLVRDKIIDKKKIIDIEDLDLNKNDVLSVFTVTIAPDGTQVFIPSLEIMLSTYTPETHTILHDLVILSTDDVVKKHMHGCVVSGKDNDTYSPKFKQNYSLSTKFFLAYLSCNNGTRQNVSKIRSSLFENEIIRENKKHSFVEVFPYHPDSLHIAVRGLYDKRNKRFWVHQITGSHLPSSYNITIEESEKDTEEREKQTQRNFQNEEPITDDLDLIDDIDAGKKVGKKYVKSNVKLFVPRRKVKKVNVKAKNPSVPTVNEESHEPAGASASPLSGQNVSKPIAAVKFGDQEGYLEMLLRVIMELGEETYFLTDEAQRKRGKVFCNLQKKKTYKGKRSNWAFIAKNRPRKLLVCEISMGDKLVYILDIERKKRDKYSGIIFSSAYHIDSTLLKQIKDTVSINQGRFGGDKDRKRFPVDNYKTFRHYSDKNRMKDNIRSLLETI